MREILPPVTEVKLGVRWDRWSGENKTTELETLGQTVVAMVAETEVGPCVSTSEVILHLT